MIGYGLDMPIKEAACAGGQMGGIEEWPEASGFGKTGCGVIGPEFMTPPCPSPGFNNAGSGSC